MRPEIAKNSLHHKAARQTNGKIVSLFRVPFEILFFAILGSVWDTIFYYFGSRLRWPGWRGLAGLAGLAGAGLGWLSMTDPTEYMVPCRRKTNREIVNAAGVDSYRIVVTTNIVVCVHHAFVSQENVGHIWWGPFIYVVCCGVNVVGKVCWMIWCGACFVFWMSLKSLQLSLHPVIVIMVDMLFVSVRLMFHPYLLLCVCVCVMGSNLLGVAMFNDQQLLALEKICILP